MNKNMVKKVILILSLIALFSIVLGGCTIIGIVTIPLRGTVSITINEDYRKAFDPVPTYYYAIFMDDNPVGEIASDGILVVEKVLLGNHTFEARDVSYVYCYGSVSEKIVSGTNYVEIPVEFHY